MIIFFFLEHYAVILCHYAVKFSHSVTSYLALVPPSRVTEAFYAWLFAGPNCVCVGVILGEVLGKVSKSGNGEG